MKKNIVSLTGVALAAALMLSSCGNSYKTVTEDDLKDGLDSVSYAAGVAMSEGLIPYLQNRMEIDTAYIDQVLAGIQAGAKEGLSEKEKAYEVGKQIGYQIRHQNMKYMAQSVFAGDTAAAFNDDLFFAAFMASVNGDSVLINNMEAQNIMREQTEKNRQAMMEAKYGENKLAGIAYLENNKNQDGWQETESGLQYKVVKSGNGKKPTPTDRVKVNYHGTLIDGTVFDSSVERGTPAEFSVSGVIKGWSEGLQLMGVGDKFEFAIPYELAYGDREMGNIKPFSTLLFEVELLEIVKK